MPAEIRARCQARTNILHPVSEIANRKTKHIKNSNNTNDLATIQTEKRSNKGKCNRWQKHIFKGTLWFYTSRSVCNSVCEVRHTHSSSEPLIAQIKHIMQYLSFSLAQHQMSCMELFSVVCPVFPVARFSQQQQWTQCRFLSFAFCFRNFHGKWNNNGYIQCCISS